MADVTLTVYEPDHLSLPIGIDMSAAFWEVVVSSNDYYMPNDGRTVIWGSNTISTARTIGFETTFTGPAGLTMANLSVRFSVQSQSMLIGPFPVEYFGTRLKVTTPVGGVAVIPVRMYS